MINDAAVGDFCLSRPFDSHNFDCRTANFAVRATPHFVSSSRKIRPRVQSEYPPAALDCRTRPVSAAAISPEPMELRLRGSS